MMLKGDSLMDALQEKYKIPRELAEFYARQADFFQTLREYRNKITHWGIGFDFIFVTEKGFAVSKDQQPFASFNVWNEEHMLPNGLSSLRPAIAHIIIQTLGACEDFSRTIQHFIQFPPDIVPGFKLFIRGHYNAELLKLNTIIENCMWWDS